MPPRTGGKRLTGIRSKRSSSSRPRPKRTGKFYFWGFVTIVAIVLVVNVTSQITGSPSSLSSLDIPSTASAPGTHWWDSEYGRRRPLETNTANSNTLLYRFDHAAMVAQARSLKDGSDLKLVAQIEDVADEVAFELTGANTNSAEIIFDTSRYPEADYYLYHANNQPKPSQVLGTVKLTKSDAELIDSGSSESPIISISTPTQWVMKYKEGSKLDLTLDLDEKSIPEKVDAAYMVLNDDLNNLHLISAATQSGPLSLDLGKVEAGHHKVFLLYQTGSEYLRSNTVRFIVSAPMYVAITIDWEGRNGEQDWVLEEYAKLSTKYKIPFTHFFNPRIFVSETIPEYRANQLTQWVKSRHIQNGDEVALHIHMYYDLVEAAEVTAIRSPRWGTGLDGYDVLASAYSYEDFTKILNWSVRQFKVRGLPRPLGFRAGGWFADSDTLKAVNDSGFSYDSSGRDSYEFGIMKAKGDWNLPYTTQPYHPDIANQNKPGSSEYLSIWELPNNGNDSYWHSLRQLKDRFYANYRPGEFLSEPKLITYLTHPDWYNVDKPRMDALMKEIDKYSLNNNSGPVVYTTLGDTLTQWE